MERIVFGFDELGQADSEKVGKKCANLGELTKAGFRVPPGFAVSLAGYNRFMNETGVRARIEDYVSAFELNPNNTADIPRYEQASVAIRQMVETTAMPADMAATIGERYEAMCSKEGVASLPVATRSAGPASHPGQYETYLHIDGTAEVVRNVIRVWGSTFNTRSLIARARQGLDLSYDAIGVAVLKMVNARAAGVMFTVNPTDGDDGKVYIESAWGLGEAVVAGEVTPDAFLVDKASSQILKRTISPKTVWYVVDAKTGTVSSQAVPEDKRNLATLDDREVLEIARLGVLVEQHFAMPQDLEWGVDASLDFPENVFLLQTRPAKTRVKKQTSTDRIIDLMMRGIG